MFLNIDWHMIGIPINILILYILMRMFLFKPIRGIMAKRKEAIDSQFETAEQKIADAEKMKSEYEQKLKQAEGESFEIIREARQKAQEEYERIVVAAKTEADKIVKDSHKAIAMQAEKAATKSQNQLADLVLDAVLKVSGQQIDDSASKKMIDDLLKEAGSAR